MVTKRKTGRVFVSYSAQDKELGRDIVRKLEAAGLEAVVAEHFAAPGVKIHEALRRAVAESDATVLLVTPTTLKSANVLYEAATAFALDKPVVPIVAGVSGRSLPGILVDYRAVPYDRLDSAVQRLARSLEGTPPVEEKTKPGGRNIPRRERRRLAPRSA